MGFDSQNKKSNNNIKYKNLICGKFTFSKNKKANSENYRDVFEIYSRKIFL